ncbi:hypothetical protein GOBAR_AA37954 [Gossypium barbadense]|uniref:Uncharacterized protein n=1 Tax=Gossypium barbadense TaxID=3634 RepID=A0A2P5VV90_GOSBA|nr:hypothetical protein GOBAR_AA37954 [Gossypium barbadense]
MRVNGGGSSNSEYPPYGHNIENEQLNYMAFKNQQASIQGLETQISQLTKLISKRPQGSLPSNTESNPKEQLNAITIQDEEGLVAPEPEPRQETEVSKGKGEVDHNDQKPMPNAVKFLKELLTNKRKLDEASHVEEISLKNLHEPCSSNNKGPLYEERRLQIEELDECYKELQSSLLLRKLQLYWKRFSMTAKSCPTTTGVSSSTLIIALVDYSP